MQLPPSHVIVFPEDSPQIHFSRHIPVSRGNCRLSRIVCVRVGGGGTPKLSETKVWYVTPSSLTGVASLYSRNRITVFDRWRSTTSASFARWRDKSHRVVIQKCD